MRPHPRLILYTLLTLAVAVTIAPARADFTRDFTIEANELFVGNLIGEILVEGHSGSDFEVVVDVRGDDSDEDRIRFEEESGARARLLIVFPLDEERDYVYPEMGRRSRTSFHVGRRNDRSSWLGNLFGFGRERIEVRGSGSGLELWADVTIRVPQGKGLVVDHGVGAIEAANVDGDIMLSVNSGHIRAEQITGETDLDTGSGHVEARDIVGMLRIDTGSGHVEASNVKGAKVTIDTGSGHVDLELCEAEEIEVDTGSGRVSVDEVQCRDLAVDTGSGGVQGRRVSADAANVDTGSGSVDLEFVRMGDGPYSVDTGSGSITLVVPDDASAHVYAETSSGGVDVDVDGVDFDRRKRDHAEFEIGNGDAEVELETGSGTIRIVQR